MRWHILLIVLLYISLGTLQGQDVNFSQHWNAPTQFEVARLASIPHLQTGIHHRNQWTNRLNSYRTYAAHVSYPLLQEGLYDPQWGAVGLEVINDISGLGNLYKTTQVKTTGNYKAALSRNHFLSFGLSASGLWSGLNTEGLTSGNQYQNGAYQAGSDLGENFQETSSSMFFFDAGVRFCQKKRGEEEWFFSASIYNLGSPKYGFGMKETYPKRISLTGGLLFMETAYVKILPNFQYQRQNTSQLTVIGSNFYYKLMDTRKRADAHESLIGVGLHSRLKHDLIVSAEIRQENFTAGVSYDFHANKNSLRPTSSFELFLTYNIAVTPKTRKHKNKDKEEVLEVPEEETNAEEVVVIPEEEVENERQQRLHEDTTNATMVEMKLLDTNFRIKSPEMEVVFQNLDDPSQREYTTSYNKDSTSFIAYLSKNTNYAVTIKKEGFYNKTLKFNTGKRDSLEIPNKLKVIVLGEVLVLNKVHFKSGMDELETSSEGELASLVAFLEEYPNIRAEISGHTDDLGADDFNLALSQKRAETIVNYLVAKGVERTRLVAKGFGESHPIVPNNSAENRAKNRRVELKIIGK